MSECFFWFVKKILEQRIQYILPIMQFESAAVPEDVIK